MMRKRTFQALLVLLGGWWALETAPVDAQAMYLCDQEICAVSSTCTQQDANTMCQAVCPFYVDATCDPLPGAGDCESNETRFFCATTMG